VVNQIVGEATLGTAKSKYIGLSEKIKRERGKKCELRGAQLYNKRI